MKIYNSILDLVGNTPIIKLKKFKKKERLLSNVYGKIESFNPAGSIKDRVALKMIEEAKKDGLLIKGSTIIEPTSGNTGIGIAFIAHLLGYKSIIVMPESMSDERKKLIEIYGGQLVLTSKEEGMSGSIKKAEELNKEIKNSIILGQFKNKANVLAHYEGTGPEIYKQLKGNIDYLVCGIGTGGTISGTGKYLKEKNPNIKIIGVEPLSSPVLTKGMKGPHLIQGIGAGFVPEILNKDIIDEIIPISNEDAFSMCKEIYQDEGLLVGISSGANLACCKILATREENQNKNIVVILPDSGERYLSVPSYMK